MANKVIDCIVYSFKRPGAGPMDWSIELIFNPHAICYPWQAFKLNSFKDVENVSIETVKQIFATMSFSSHVEVQLKESYGGEVYCYQNGKQVIFD